MILRLRFFEVISRWAAKEAVFKAHRHRRLGFQEISIADPRRDAGCPKVGGQFNLNAVVDPPTRSVRFDPKVAMLRGLRGFRGNEEGSGAKYMGLEHKDQFAPIEPGHLSFRERLQSSPIRSSLLRRELVKDEDRQIAELSIAHEKSVAVAVCMAWRNPNEERIGPLKSVVDDGSGQPIHEPAWGDQGFGVVKDHIANNDG